MVYAFSATAVILFWKGLAENGAIIDFSLPIVFRRNVDAETDGEDLRNHFGRTMTRMSELYFWFLKLLAIICGIFHSPEATERIPGYHRPMIELNIHTCLNYRATAKPL